MSDAPEIPAPTTPIPVQTVPDRPLRTPPIDIYDTAEGLALVADLPGVTSGDLELQVRHNQLTLYGRVTSTVPLAAKVLHREYADGDFVRSFILSDDVDHERIVAKLANGVLDVSLPQAPRAQPRRIQVNGE